MRALFLVMLIALGGAWRIDAQTVTGDWQGTLNAGGQQLRLLLHVKGDTPGAYSGTLDSLDQNAKGIAVTALAVKDGVFSFEVPAVKGSYSGKLNATGDAINGTWSQGAALPLTFQRAVVAPAGSKPAAGSSDIDGDYLGVLDAGAAKLRLAFHLFTADSLLATLDSLDQGASGIPATSAKRDGDTLVLEWKAINGKFTGKISADRKTIDGTWTQGAGSLPLVIKRTTTPPPAARRPQVPVKPYPYREEEVTYPNKSAKLELAGTLTLPTGSGPFPAVLLITGSGPQDRDESLLGHKPFLVLADYLTRQGIAVLRVDDRGTGKSTGTFANATTADFAIDAEAGVAFLRSRAEVDSRRIGLLGHSEGGVVAPIVAAKDRGIAFVVLMAGTTVPGEQILLAQQRLISQAMGAKEGALEQATALNRAVYTLVKEEKDDATFARRYTEQFGAKMPAEQIQAQIKQVSSPWFRYFLTYDPAPALRQLKCPVLALNGAKDLQVPPDLNLPAMRQILASNPGSEVVELPNLNHLFQTASTGSPAEYGQIEETIAPVALNKIGDWIKQRTRAEARP